MMKKRDEKLRLMLKDLGRALTEVIADTPEINQTVRQIRREGYTLQLLLDCKRDAITAEPMAVSREPAQEAEPSFRIDSRDLSFLRSVGIDPTRQLRRRRN